MTCQNSGAPNCFKNVTLVQVVLEVCLGLCEGSALKEFASIGGSPSTGRVPSFMKPETVCMLSSHGGNFHYLLLNISEITILCCSRFLTWFTLHFQGGFNFLLNCLSI